MLLLCVLSSFADIPVQADWLRTEGGRLFEGDEEVSVISINRWDLLYDYIAEYWPEHIKTGALVEREYGIDAARLDLKTFSEHGFNVIRVSATLYWSKPMHNTYYADPDKWWAAFDQMLDDCDTYGIRVILLLNHHLFLFPDLGHESRQTFFRDPLSASRKLHDLYIREIVKRYADRQTVYFWEISTEVHLRSNLGFQDPEGKKRQGILRGAEHLVTYPIVRSASDHFTTEDGINYLRSTGDLIRSLDTHHLLGSGNSTPRPASWHLMRAAQTHGKGDWTPDSYEQTAEFIRLTNPDPIDLISVHYYEEAQKVFGGNIGNLDNLEHFAQISRDIGKPLYIGEMGPPGADYVTPEQIEWTRKAAKRTQEIRIPVALFWTWNDLGHPPCLTPGRTDEAIKTISTAAQSTTP